MRRCRRLLAGLALALGAASALGAVESPGSRAAPMVISPDLAAGPSRLLAALPVEHRNGALMDALSDVACRVAMAPASVATMAALAEHPGQLDTFTARGGWLMLWDLEPAALASFDRLVGVEHLLRPPIMENITVPDPPDPLIAGLDPGQVVMDSDLRGPFAGGMRDPDAWSGVVDGDDIAPFCTLPTSEHWGIKGAGYGHDRDPRNLVNGFTDQWYFGFTIALDKPEQHFIPMRFPRVEEVVGFTMAPDPIYSRIVRLRLNFPEPGNPPIDLGLASQGTGLQEFWFPEGVCTAGVTLEVVEVTGTNVTISGIRNCWIRVKRPADFHQRVHQLLSIGVLNAYPRGRGGIVLNQIRVADPEPADGVKKANACKQREIVRCLLHNLIGG